MNKNIFNSIQVNAPKKNVFDLTHDVKLSTNFGRLTPVLCMECVPGDSFNIGCEALVKTAPMLAPLMHRMDVTMHYFFVPNRILWENWETFITDSQTLTPPVMPFIRFGSDSVILGSMVEPKSLADYLGLPLTEGGNDAVYESVSALPFAAYQKIYNEYYRDQNLIAELDLDLPDGDITELPIWTTMTTIRTRAWQHDYFTAALPFAQKGAAVEMPLLADVTLKDAPQLPGKFVHIDDYADFDTGNVTMGGVPPNGGIDIAAVPHLYDPNGSLQVDGASTTINDFRRAIKLQEWLELAARAGSRYTENIFAFFGVRSPDARLQRPEYITGTKSPVMVSEVLNTTGSFDPAAPTDPASPPQGYRSGNGISVTNGKYGNYYCQEHGYIIGIMSVLPMPAYQQGIPKHFLKINDKYDFYWPQFAHLGEQEVLKNELVAYQEYTEDTFGYVPRYAEYKYMPNRVAGDFRTTLNYWHMGRIFATDNTIALNQEFVECVARQDVFAVTDEAEDKLYCQVVNKIRAVRPMPKFGTPSI